MEHIIFEGDAGVVILAPDTDCGLTILEIGQKDVPAGVPFWITDISEYIGVPTESWEIDKTVEASGIGGTYDKN